MKIVANPGSQKGESWGACKTRPVTKHCYWERWKIFLALSNNEPGRFFSLCCTSTWPSHQSPNLCSLRMNFIWQPSSLEFMFASWQTRACAFDSVLRVLMWNITNQYMFVNTLKERHWDILEVKLMPFRLYHFRGIQFINSSACVAILRNF